MQSGSLLVQIRALLGIAVKQDSALPELMISVHVPKQLAPVDQGLLHVETLLVEPTSSANPRTLWRAKAGSRRFTRFGTLRDLVPMELDRNLDELAAARSAI